MQDQIWGCWVCWFCGQTHERGFSSWGSHAPNNDCRINTKTENISAAMILMYECAESSFMSNSLFGSLRTKHSQSPRQRSFQAKKKKKSKKAQSKRNEGRRGVNLAAVNMKYLHVLQQHNPQEKELAAFYPNSPFFFFFLCLHHKCLKHWGYNPCLTKKHTHTHLGI